MSFIGFYILISVNLIGNLMEITNAYKILAVLPFPSPSHHVITDALLTKLTEIGHEVTVYTPYPTRKNISNFIEHDIGQCRLTNFEHSASLDHGLDNMVRYRNPFLILFSLYTLSREYVPDYAIETCPPLYKLLNSTKKFDLLVYESFFYDLPLLYANKFNVPFITFSPQSLSPWLALRMQNPMNPSYNPHYLSGYLTKMNFFERTISITIYLTGIIIYQYYSLKRDEEINRRLLGDDVPSLYDMVKNTSVLFVSNHHSFGPVGPLLPGVIEIGGIHIKPAKTLSQNIEKFINESQHGVVYFCMGSLLRGETFPKEKREAFLNAFAKIPQRVLWKWEGEVLPGKSDNIMISKWMPQRDILAHPNIKLFISHGGLLGTSEAVYVGVPILGIPIFGDQRTNIRSLESNGAGELLEYNEISEEIVLEKITRLTSDPKYKENAKALSERYRDRPMSPLDTAVYWTEYVIRHKGAPHLKSAAVELTWYQYLLLDVIAFIIAVLVAVVFTIYYILKLLIKCIRYLICGSPKSPKNTSKLSSKSSKKVD